ncbi:MULTISPECIES: PucR family transcriptional regulator [Prauserella salsuginis group]|uniref:PucR family transcriptional regulator n=1 Tax=Prauserella salsuginis TaxID=387889 RepID=A0ABW6FVX1_9PSEU|nr:MULTISPECIES: helix-turn-helix domain-containing protein [Prauserella salsuginis group]MCR3720137.1 PucR C-terminal helix-turn-helix domain-containing protein [Prauserella flava]MCR3734154.1 PucR C-terminal helix-turn-helix domain-containing protein [Prauserella salsuginis]
MNHGEGSLAELADLADARLAELADDVVADCVDRMDVYRTVVPREDLRRSIEHNLRYIVAALRDPGDARDLSAPRETGRRRAHQGAPLPEVLRAYRLAFTAVWDVLIRRAGERHEPTRTTLLGAATLLWQLADEHAIELTEAYRAATAELLDEQHQRRAALLEALFTGQVGPDASPWEIAKLLDLQPNADLVVVAAENGALADAGLPRVERRLAERGIVSAWRLTPTLHTGVVSLRPGQRDELFAVLREAVTTRTGVSPPYQALRDTPRALHLAGVALAGIPTGQSDVHAFGTSPLAALVACEPDESERVAYQVLGSVLELPADDRTSLLDTLHAWFDHGGSAEQAAKQLYCHPNTVRYRLRRINELTGRSLTQPFDVAELATALHSLSLGKDPTPGRGQQGGPDRPNRH